MLTIGFGDSFVPTYTSTRILLLPFAVVTISQLANEVAMIIGYFSVRTQHRRQRWREKYEHSIRELQREKNPHASLQDEVELLEEISNREELMAEVWDLAWSLSSLIVFWMAGAAVFSHIEPGWTFGDALYFQVVFCLTIGYGDFAPTTPGSKVFWVIYALMAVPLIASFAVQAVTGLLSTFSQRRVDLIRKRKAKGTFTSAFTQHKDLVLQYRKTFDHLLPAEQEGTKEPPNSPRPLNDGESALLAEIIDAGIRMEAVGRKLLIDNLPRSSLGRSILEADRNLQLRDIKAAGGDLQHVRSLWQEEDDNERTDAENSLRNAPSLELETPTTLSEIRRYRDNFAHFLVAASKAQRLDGQEQFQFERWQKYDEDDDEETQVERPSASQDAEAGPDEVPGTLSLIERKLKTQAGREQKDEKSDHGSEESEAEKLVSKSKVHPKGHSEQGQESRLTPEERETEKRRLERELEAIPPDRNETEDVTEDHDSNDDDD